MLAIVHHGLHGALVLVEKNVLPKLEASRLLFPIAKEVSDVVKSIAIEIEFGTRELERVLCDKSWAQWNPVCEAAGSYPLDIKVVAVVAVREYTVFWPDHFQAMQIIALSLMMFPWSMDSLYPLFQKSPIFGDVSTSKNSLLGVFISFSH